MRIWLIAFAWLGGFTTVSGVIFGLWRKLLKPIAINSDLVKRELLPLLKAFNAQFGSEPNLISVIKAMAEQFQKDSGSSLRDVVDRLESVMAENNAATVRALHDAKNQSFVLGQQLMLAEKLANIDRDAQTRLMLSLDRVGVKVDSGLIAIARMEGEQAKVSIDLADSHARADAAGGQPAGAAADAASFSGHPSTNPTTGANV